MMHKFGTKLKDGSGAKPDGPEEAAGKSRKGSSRQVSWSESVQTVNSSEDGPETDEGGSNIAIGDFKTPRIRGTQVPPESPPVSSTGSPAVIDSPAQQPQGDPSVPPVQAYSGIYPSDRTLAALNSGPRSNSAWGGFIPSPSHSPIPVIPPAPAYHFPRSNIPQHQAQFSGSSPYYSPPVPWLPGHLRRGQKSIPHSSSPSMLQEVFSAENSPAYFGEGQQLAVADQPKIGHEFEQGPGKSGNGPESLENLLFNGRMRVRLQAAPTGWMTPGPRPYGSPAFNFPLNVAWHLDQASSPHDAESSLSDLLHATNAGESDPNWITALAQSESSLKNLFRLCDLVTPVDSVLNPKSPCAEVIDLLLEHYHVEHLLGFVCRPDSNGATGLRHLICKARSMGNPAGEPRDTGVIRITWTHDTAADHAYEIIYMSGADSISTIPALRLFESILSGVWTLDQLQRPTYRSFLEAVIYLIKRKGHVRQGEGPGVDPARRTAALHVISSTLRTYKSLLSRLEADSETPTMPKEEWILQKLGISDIVPYLHDKNGHPLVRCMALRVLRDFADVDVDEVSRWEKLEDSLSICADVVLWKTKWQHGHEATSKSLDIAKFCPHDDAYRIMASSPPHIVIPILAKSLKTDDKSTLLEPLMSLIVDHSALKDKYWPFMLSILLHSGCLSLFHDILLRPVPPEKDFLFRTSCRAKAEACIGLSRCFEQMRAKDIKTIPPNIGLTLAKLANDEKLPVNLRGRANDAFGALKE
ncbi:hypothetical protein FRC00_002562 [Tulasnella sp. 408]|nr:hypothetical protein FRC00_002562 [Tulasnella sp. 408]